MEAPEFLFYFFPGPLVWDVEFFSLGVHCFFQRLCNRRELLFLPRTFFYISLSFAIVCTTVFDGKFLLSASVDKVFCSGCSCECAIKEGGVYGG